jgi:hypothetical protein
MAAQYFDLFNDQMRKSLYDEIPYMLSSYKVIYFTSYLSSQPSNRIIIESLAIPIVV